jgi:hypothetical protein
VNRKNKQIKFVRKLRSGKIIEMYTWRQSGFEEKKSKYKIFNKLEGIT